jgi:hypothetical protein
MTHEIKDAAQALGETMALGQDWLRRLETAPPSDAAPAADAGEMVNRYSQMQPDLANEVSRFRTSMSGLMGSPHTPSYLFEIDERLGESATVGFGAAGQ